MDKLIIQLNTKQIAIIQHVRLGAISGIGSANYTNVAGFYWQVLSSQKVWCLFI